MSPSALEELKIRQVPAVFIDGRFAEGWELPGFMDTFAQDCAVARLFGQRGLTAITAPASLPRRLSSTIRFEEQ